ncbi:MAG UNVERIFIED_CONTAM: hypothetical protein LVQ98_06745 [Rickettsiaceae bacterium]|jgi:hypothetical protein
MIIAQHPDLVAKDLEAFIINGHAHLIRQYSDFFTPLIANYNAAILDPIMQGTIVSETRQF